MKKNKRNRQLKAYKKLQSKYNIAENSFVLDPKMSFADRREYIALHNALFGTFPPLVDPTEINQNKR